MLYVAIAGLLPDKVIGAGSAGTACPMLLVPFLSWSDALVSWNVAVPQFGPER